uniref:Uncharacterized protein LOC114336181 isoform X2 n=1 Tax=Diabrotica virgifera virgifera TaxID=50390 RepID=A0A6P7G5L8_DIAVI
MFYRIIIWFMFVSFCHASWVNDIISPKGWKFGDGMVFHIEDTKDKNVSLLDRIALKVDYGKVEVSAVQKPEKEAVQLNFFFKDEEEGRSKKNMGNVMVPFLIGVAKAPSASDQIPAVAISPYHAYEPYAAAESALNYATVVEAPVDNKTAPVKQYYVQPATKRRDLGRRKVIPAVLTIRQYSRPESGLL